MTTPNKFIPTVPEWHPNYNLERIAHIVGKRLSEQDKANLEYREDMELRFTEMKKEIEAMELRIYRNLMAGKGQTDAR